MERIFLFSLLFVLSVNVLAQGCIRSLVDLERSILSDDDNVQSLVEAFYPANRFPALWVEVQYYIIQPAEERDNNLLQYESNYTFFWAISPVLIYIHPKMLEGISLRFVTIDYHSAKLVISPFCANVSQDTSLTIINSATIWMKSYAVNRIESIAEGIDPSLQGYTTYKPFQDRDELFVLHRESTYQDYVAIMVLALFLSVLFTQIVVPVQIWRRYSKLQIKMKEGLQHKEQHFRFKSLIWGGVAALIIVDIAIIVINLHNYITFGLQWNDNSRIIYYFLLFGLSIVLTIGSTFSLIITAKAYKKDELIELPKFLVLTKKKPWLQTGLHLMFQFVFILTLLLSAIGFVFHGCGVILAVLANPVQVFATMIFSVMIATYLVFMFTYIFETYEVSDHRWLQFLEAMLRLTLGVIFVTFIVLFGLTYLNVILFAGTDSTGVVNSLSQILPAVLLASTGWLIKKEYDNFTGRKLDKDSNDELIKDSNDELIKDSNELVTTSI